MTVQEPTPTPTGTDLEQKKSYLDILAIFHYVYGGVGLVFTLFAAAVVVGIFSIPEVQRDIRTDAGCLPMIVFGFFIALGILYCLFNLLAGRWLQQRRQRVPILVVSGLNCLNFPLGTLLGVFVIALLAQVEVKALFDAR